MRVAAWYKMGLPPEEIAVQYGHLSLAQVHAALAYYHANPEEIEADLAEEEAFADKVDHEAQSPIPAMSRIRLYFDEDAMQQALVVALRARRIDVLTAMDCAMAGRSDEDHLLRAVNEGRVLYSFNIKSACTIGCSRYPRCKIYKNDRHRYRYTRRTRRTAVPASAGHLRIPG